MKLDVFDAIALTIHANDDQIVSKTSIQKLVYFHTLTIKDIDISGYTHYFYGPFNRQVSIALEDMSEFSYIDQNVVSGYYETYNYKLTENGIKYAENAISKYPDEYGIMKDTIQICKQHCKLKPSPLSYAAKAHYILSNSKDQLKEKFTPEDVKNIAKDFDWKISEEDALTGLQLLQKLNLVDSK